MASKRTTERIGAVLGTASALFGDNVGYLIAGVILFDASKLYFGWGTIAITASDLVFYAVMFTLLQLIWDMEKSQGGRDR